MNAELKNNSLSALVVEGGAMRGIFSTGVLDAFLESGFNPFDICIGVSAGSTNLAAYLAQAYKRNYKVYTTYSVRPEFISWRKFIMGGHLVDLDWLWDITIRELRLDLERIINSGKEYYIGVTEAQTGKAVYLKPDKYNLEEIIKASSSLPVFYRNTVKINDIEYVDGSMADPIPVIEAYKKNARNILVLRSRPYSFSMKQKPVNLFTRHYLKKYPAIITVLQNRAKKYKEAIDFMRNPPEGVKIIEVNPPESFQTSRLTKDVSILKRDYEQAHKIGLETINRWRSELSIK